VLPYSPTSVSDSHAKAGQLFNPEDNQTRRTRSDCCASPAAYLYGAFLKAHLQPLGAAYLKAGCGAECGAGQGDADGSLVLHRVCGGVDALRDVTNGHKRQAAEGQDGQQLAVAGVDQLPAAIQQHQHL